MIGRVDVVVPKIRVLLLSSIIPANTYGGPLVLHRHLREQNDLEVLEIGDKDVVGQRASLLDRAVTRLTRTRFRQVALHLKHLRGESLPSEVESRINRFDPQVVLTVAHGRLFWLALKFARRRRLPLVSIFHDWWPHLAKNHLGGISDYTAKLVERRFRTLYRLSDCVLPVCPGMQESLGQHSNCTVVPPIPPKIDPTAEVEAGFGCKSNRRIVYSGNMTSGYGSALRCLLAASGSLRSSFQFVGGASDWPDSVASVARNEGILSHGMIPESDLKLALSNSLALLVTLPFEIDPEIYQRTSFPSKLMSYLQYGRPIVFWGPNYSSIIRWAKENGAKAVFDNKDPAELIHFLEKLKVTPERENELCQESHRLRALFCPQLIQQIFINAIHTTLDMTSCRGR